MMSDGTTSLVITDTSYIISAVASQSTKALCNAVSAISFGRLSVFEIATSAPSFLSFFYSSSFDLFRLFLKHSAAT